MSVDFKTVPTNHLGALVAFAVAFVASLFGAYVSYSVEVPDEAEALGVGDTSGGASSAWTGYATLGMLLLITAAAIVAIRAFAPHVLPTGVPWQLVALAAAALGTLLVILRAVTYSESFNFGEYSSSTGPGWSGYALFVAAIVQTVFTALGFKESGEEAPWANRGTTTQQSSTAPPTVAGPASSAPPAPPTSPPAPPPTQQAPPSTYGSPPPA